MSTVCPHCGYCPHCGRSNGWYHRYPYWWNTVTGGGSIGSSIGGSINLQGGGTAPDLGEVMGGEPGAHYSSETHPEHCCHGR